MAVGQARFGTFSVPSPPCIWWWRGRSRHLRTGARRRPRVARRDRQVPYFVDYLKRYTDTSFLVTLERDEEDYRPGRYLRANRLARYRDARCERGAGPSGCVRGLAAGTPRPISLLGSDGHLDFLAL